MVIKKARFLFLISFLWFGVLILIGCSSDEDKATQERSQYDHVWKAQTQALDKAKGVEQMIQSTAEQHNQAIEEQSQ